MQALGIRKAPDIEEIVEGYASLDSDEKRKEIIVEGEMFGGLMEKYEAALEYCVNKDKSVLLGEKMELKVRRLRLPTLLPGIICAFTAATTAYEGNKNNSVKNTRDFDYSKTKGIFVTRLIQNSYEAGYNDFHITGLSIPLIYLGLQLTGDEQNPLIVSVDGGIGMGCGHEAKNCIFSGAWIGWGSGNDAEGCTFITKDIADLEELNKSVEKGNGNKIVLVHADGSEEEWKL